MAKGKVYLIGAGPSDPGLLTVKGKKLLQLADVVIYDRLVGTEILSEIPPSAQKIDVGKTAGNHPIPQQEINRLLLQKAQEGLTVVRLKGGDPFVFGRGGEELELLAEHNIPFEIVPGVTSALAVAAYAGIPVTHRDFCSSIHIITAHRKQGKDSLPDFDTLAKLDGTLVFLMGVSSLPIICTELIRAGMPQNTPAAVLERGTTAKQRRIVADLETLPQRAEAAKIQTPAIILVGAVCTLSKQFHWAEDRPLGTKRILITRPKERISSFAQKLEDLGAEVIQLPCIQIVSSDPAPLEKELRRINCYQWIAFTSAAGANCFFKQMKQMKLDLRSLCGIRFAAIGPATKETIESYGIIPDYMPHSYTGKALGCGLSEQIAPNESVLIPRSRIGTDELTGPLKKADIAYTDCPVYDIVYPQKLDFPVGEYDFAAFTSASTVHGFTNALPNTDFSAVHAVCIGEQTAKAARQYGMNVIISKEATIDSMIETLLDLSK